MDLILLLAMANKIAINYSQFYEKTKLHTKIFFFFHRLPQPQSDRMEKLELVIQLPKVVEEKSTRTSS